MNEKLKLKSHSADVPGNRWLVLKLLLCLVLATVALAISLLAPDQLLSGGVVSWTIVAALLSGVVLAINMRS